MKGAVVHLRTFFFFTKFLLHVASGMLGRSSVALVVLTPGTPLETLNPLCNLRARRVKVRFIRVLGRGKRVFKDSVRLIARFYSRSEYDKPLKC